MARSAQLHASFAAAPARLGAALVLVPALLGACRTVLDIGDPISLQTADTDSSPCGNGKLDADEECDDGNRVARDGCDPGCFVEHDFRCSAAPSVCYACPDDKICGPLKTSACCDVVQVSHSTVSLDSEPVVVPAFYLDKYEVTVGRFHLFTDRYQEFREAHACKGKTCTIDWNPALALPESAPDLTATLRAPQCPSGTFDGERSLPINCVGFAVAAAFCAFEGSRLPSRAEWRAAATNGDTTAYPWGDVSPTSSNASCPPGSFANFNPMVAISSPESVGSKACDGGDQGIFDLAGNVAEWATLPGNASGKPPVLGGSFASTDEHAIGKFGEERIAVDDPPRDDIGFRCAHDIPGP